MEAGSTCLTVRQNAKTWVAEGAAPCTKDAKQSFIVDFVVGLDRQENINEMVRLADACRISRSPLEQPKNVLRQGSSILMLTTQLGHPRPTIVLTVRVEADMEEAEQNRQMM